jgi:hypothetical protein
MICVKSYFRGYTPPIHGPEKKDDTRIFIRRIEFHKPIPAIHKKIMF